MAISRIYEQARTAPDKTAVVYNDASCSYSHFARWIEGTRRYLAGQDLPAGSVAVIAASTVLDGWVLGFALRSLGLTTIATRDAEHSGALRLHNVGCVVTMADGDQPAPANPAADPGWRVIVVPPDIRLAAVAGALPRDLQTHSRPGGHILMTSATTGAYKLVLRDAVAEARGIPASAAVYGIADDSVVYVPGFKLWMAGGHRWPLTTWSVGGTVVLHGAPDRLRPPARHDITHFFATPDILANMLHAPEVTPRRNDATHLLVTGGALPQALLERARRQLTQKVSTVLASTEASVLAVTPVERPDDLLWHRIDPSREVQVVDEADRVLGPGREGMVRARILDGVTGYLDDEAATREFFRDGYFYPGDVGMLGDDGRLSLRGRAADIVNVLGNKIATGPIERALQDRLGAEGVCIIAIPGDEIDAEMHLVIESGRRIEQAEIKAAASAELGMLNRVPVRVDLIAKLPRNEMGKVRRLELAQWLLRARKTRRAQRG